MIFIEIRLDYQNTHNFTLQTWTRWKLESKWHLMTHKMQSKWLHLMHALLTSILSEALLSSFSPSSLYLDPREVPPWRNEETLANPAGWNSTSSHDFWRTWMRLKIKWTLFSWNENKYRFKKQILKCQWYISLNDPSCHAWRIPRLKNLWNLLLTKN